MSTSRKTVANVCNGKKARKQNAPTADATGMLMTNANLVTSVELRQAISYKWLFKARAAMQEMAVTVVS